MITIEQPMTNRQNAIECTGKQEENDQAKLCIDDDPVISIDKLSYCGHNKPPVDSFVPPYLAASEASYDSSGHFKYLIKGYRAAG